MLQVIIYIIGSVILLKYMVILLGFIGISLLTAMLKRKNKHIDYTDVEGIRESHARKNQLNESLARTESLMAKCKKYLINLVIGYMRYSSMQTGKIPSHKIRNFLYRHVFHMEIGKNVLIYGGSEVRSPQNIKIGDGTIIGDDSKLDGRNGITIGRNVNFSTGVWIWTEQHNAQCPNFSCINEGAPVIIGDRAWVSCRTVILPGVTIGEGAIIAAGAVVTKDVEPFTIYGGIPAKKIGERNKDLTYEFDGECIPFY